MLAWQHSGFHTHDGVWVGADDREFTVRLARYCARNPVALSRLEYHEQDSSVTYHSDIPTGPTAGSETTDALEFLARLTSHIPSKGQVLQRTMDSTHLARGELAARPTATVTKSRSQWSTPSPRRSTASSTTCVVPEPHADASALRRDAGSPPPAPLRSESTLTSPDERRSGGVGVPGCANQPSNSPVHPSCEAKSDLP